ncbi:CCR4-NOT transcription complex subunit 4 [Nematocida sp. LUAm3]|nr:CCR4-NOT transcription complex subunit 4 [Nematocida sp. LUAm3]KAI5175231.1 CCR4-NOT transcription complex subunit 4 [Nematocida sp. LUAm2]KAI5178097.1 CCR4-NOT transcription complex subunit 4 [Nematocida sp. LUAm1]
MHAVYMDREQEKEELQNIRVLQRNLVYAVGIPGDFAREDLLCSKSLFGGFGEIMKVVLSKRKEVRQGSQEGMYSTYITYLKSSSAADAIREMDGFVLGDKIIRCTFGTTKYCSFFLRGIKCTNEGCLYLHEKGKEEDSFSRDQMSVLKTKIERIIDRKDKEEKKQEEKAPVEEEQSVEEQQIENIEGLTALFLFKPQQETKGKHYENCHFNPFYRRTKEETPEQKMQSICAKK